MKTKTTIAVFASVAAIVFGYFCSVAGAATLHDFVFSDFAQTYTGNIDTNAGENLVCIVQTNDSSDSITGLNDGEASLSPLYKNQESVGNAGWKYIFEATLATTQTSVTIVKTGTPTIAFGCESIANGHGIDTYDFKDVNASSLQMNATTTDANDFVIGLMRAYSQPADVINGYPRANDGGDIALVDSNGSSTTPGQQFTLGIGNSSDQYSGTIVSIRGETGSSTTQTAYNLVYIVKPEPGETREDYSHNFWEVSWEVIGTSSQSAGISVRMRYSATSTFSTYFEDTSSYSIEDATSPNWFTGTDGNGNQVTAYYQESKIFPKATELTTSTAYWAQAFLDYYTWNDQTNSFVTTSSVASSSIRKFYINNIPPPEAKCNGVWDCVLYGFANSMLTPHDLSLNSYKATYAQLQTTFPFSALFGYITTAENSASAASSSQANYDVKLQFPAPWNTITLLTSSSYSSFVGTSTAFTKENFFDIQRMVIWIGTGLKIISMFIV